MHLRSRGLGTDLLIAGFDGELLEPGPSQPRAPARRDHPLHAAAPLLDEAEFLEHAADDAVAKARHAVLHLLDRQPREQDAVVE